GNGGTLISRGPVLGGQVTVHSVGAGGPLAGAVVGVLCRPAAVVGRAQQVVQVVGGGEGGAPRGAVDGRGQVPGRVVPLGDGLAASRGLTLLPVVVVVAEGLGAAVRHRCARGVDHLHVLADLAPARVVGEGGLAQRGATRAERRGRRQQQVVKGVGVGDRDTRRCCWRPGRWPRGLYLDRELRVASFRCHALLATPLLPFLEHSRLIS